MSDDRDHDELPPAFETEDLDMGGTYALGIALLWVMFMLIIAVVLMVVLL